MSVRVKGVCQPPPAQMQSAEWRLLPDERGMPHSSTGCWCHKASASVQPEPWRSCGGERSLPGQSRALAERGGKETEREITVDKSRDVYATMQLLEREPWRRRFRGEEGLPNCPLPQMWMFTGPQACILSIQVLLYPDILPAQGLQASPQDWWQSPLHLHHSVQASGRSRWTRCCQGWWRPHKANHGSESSAASQGMEKPGPALPGQAMEKKKNRRTRCRTAFAFSVFIPRAG